MTTAEPAKPEWAGDYEHALVLKGEEVLRFMSSIYQPTKKKGDTTKQDSRLKLNKRTVSKVAVMQHYKSPLM